MLLVKSFDRRVLGWFTSHESGYGTPRLRHERPARSRLKGYTRLTIEIPNSGPMDSSVCGYLGEALFDQRLIPLGFARSFAAGRGQEIAKEGSKRVMAIYNTN